MLAQISANKSFFIEGVTGFVPFHINLLLRTGLFLVYLFFSWKLAIQNVFIKERNQHKLAKYWILFLLVIVTVVQLITLLPFIFKMIFVTAQSEYLLYRSYASLFSLLLLAMILFVLYNPTILYGYVFVSKEYVRIENKNYLLEISQHLETPILIEPIKVDKKPIAVVLANNEQLYLKTILSFMETHKPFLNPDFTIGILSQETAIPVHHCSYIVNYIIGKNFREWVNGFRIDYFEQLYMSTSKTKTILALFIESGFKSKATFYNAFAKERGELPNNYFSE